MNRSVILECMYSVIKESVEWGIEEEEYGMFVDGVLAMTEKLIEETKLDDRVKEVEKHFEGWSTDRCYVDELSDSNNEIAYQVQNRHDVTIAKPIMTLTNHEVLDDGYCIDGKA